jgi:2-hydroxy-6-oxonona-2,4-dienedioate hydrolase
MIEERIAMNTTAPSLTEVATSRFVRIKEGDLDLQLHYNDAGQGNQVIVMLHGSGPGASGWANFNRNIEPMVAAGYRVILMDCPGWSKSDTLICSGSRSDLNARALNGLLDGIGIDGRVHIIGNSMGAHSTVAFALAYPQRVGKLVLMGGGTGGPSQFVPMPTEGIKLVQALYRDPSIENLKKMMNVFVFDTSSLTEELFQARLDNMLSRRDHLENFVKSLAANPKQFTDYGPRLGEITAPSLIIWGRDDRFVPLDIGLKLLWGIPNADLHVFNRCGHWAQWEHVEKFNRLVLDFFRD